METGRFRGSLLPRAISIPTNQIPAESGIPHTGVKALGMRPAEQTFQNLEDTRSDRLSFIDSNK